MATDAIDYEKNAAFWIAMHTVLVIRPHPPGIGVGRTSQPGARDHYFHFRTKQCGAAIPGCSRLSSRRVGVGRTPQGPPYSMLPFRYEEARAGARPAHALGRGKGGSLHHQ